MARTQPATLVFGAKICNAGGEKVGHIQDLVVDLKSGQVLYAVISYSGEKVQGSTYVPIPVTALKENTDRNEIILDIQHEQLQNAPHFEKPEWPKAYDREFIDRIYTHYGYEPPDQ